MKRLLWKVILFIILALGFTVVLGGIQQETGFDFWDISLAQLGPMLAAFLMILAIERLNIVFNFDPGRNGLLKIVLALFIPLFLFMVVFFIAMFFDFNVRFTENIADILPPVIVGMILGSFAEETGWRSFLQPLLEKKYSALSAAVFTGILWGLWHVNLYQNGWNYMLEFLLFTVSASIIIAWLLRGSNFCLLISGVFHFAVNLGFLLFFRYTKDNSNIILINGLIWTVSAIAVVLLKGVTLRRK